ncbi:MAG: S8 family serine peptidase, partial [Thermoplasmata archaeon]|nr:S8 family serine peptidase [Thermoplasmata archaeon]
TGVDVISLSIGLGPEGGAIADAVNALSVSGVVVVAAAGNSGGQAGGDENAYWPDGAMIVGGIDDMATIDREDDLVWSRSTYGPRPSDGDSDPLDELRPDLVAPAVEISVASFSLTSNVKGASGWSQGSGTSYASPHCSGVVALMLQANPAIAPTPLSNPVRKILHASSEQRGDPYDELISPVFNERYGYGMLDAYDAVGAARDHTGANGRPQILSFEIKPSTTTIGSICSVRVQAVDPDEDLLSYEISADGGSITGEGPKWEWSAPDEPGYYTLVVVVSDPLGSSDTSRSSVQVEEGIPNRPPLITSFGSSRASLPAGESTTLTVTAMDADGDNLTYSYSVSDGTIEGEGSVVEYTAPGETGSVRITATVQDGKGGEDTEEMTLDIRDVSDPVPPVINLASISPSVVEGDAENVTLIVTAKVEDDEGLEDIESVFADLSSLGKGATTMMYDDGEGADSTGGDGVYTVEVSSLSGVEAGNYTITVTVIDLSGLTHSTVLDLEFRSVGFDEVDMGKSVTVDPMFAILVIALLVVAAVIIFVYVRRRRRRETVLRPVPQPQQELQYQAGVAEGYQQYYNPYEQPGAGYEQVDPQYLPQQPIFRPVQEQTAAYQ